MLGQIGPRGHARVKCTMEGAAYAVYYVYDYADNKALCKLKYLRL